MRLKGASLTVIVKGSRKNAQRAAARHGINARCRGRSVGGALCHVPCSQLTKVARWLGERTTGTKSGRGYAPGVVTFYSDRACSTGLGGARKRRKRRR